MALQRCLLHSTRQLIARSPAFRRYELSYCERRHKHATVPPHTRFTDRHEWVAVDKDIGTVGISDYAQEALGDVVFAQLPDVNTQLAATDECGALESVKAASEIYSPVSGTVVEKNSAVEEKPGLINSSAYDKGWLFRLKLSKPEELDKLMNEEQYKQFLETDSEKDH